MRRAILIASVAVVGSTSGAFGGNDETGDFKEVVYDLTGVAYSGGPPVIQAALDIGAAQIMELRWQNVVLETYNNTGTWNWASEAFLGFQADTPDGSTIQVMVQPFPDTNTGGGPFGPVDGSLDVELADLFSNATGQVHLLKSSNWDDGSGMSAGTYLAGELILVYAPIPAPGALCLLAVAGLTRRRRRG